jgi:hypothetical protein
MVQPSMSMLLAVGLWISNHSPFVSETAAGFCMISLMTNCAEAAPALQTSSKARKCSISHSLSGPIQPAGTHSGSMILAKEILRVTR